MPPDSSLISLAVRNVGVIVVIATVLAHGALITSVGLAMAVWVKRQSRAIAISVGSFILVTAAWPICILTTVRGNYRFGQSLASLSPVVLCGTFINFFTNRRYAFVEGILLCGSFWTVEVVVVAIGLLWLTVRTFDGCFDRIPDRPHRISVVAIVVVILAGMIGVGSLVEAAGTWIEGVQPGWLGEQSSVGITCYSLVITIGLVLVAVESAELLEGKVSKVSDLCPPLPARSIVLCRWWKAFRLVLLLAIGPALVALAMATAHEAPRYEPRYTTDASGNEVFSAFVLAKTDLQYPGKVQLGRRLSIAAVFIVTILVHGGAAAAIGLGLTAAKPWTRRAVASALSLGMLVIFIVPLYLLPFNIQHKLDSAAMWSFVISSNSLLTVLFTRTSFSSGDIFWDAVYWDVLVSLLAIGLTWWTVDAWQRRASETSTAGISLANDLRVGPSAVATGSVAD